MLKIEGLIKNYGKLRALDGLSMTIKKGELFGFVGPNGAGKTTTIRIMAGLLKADSGTVWIDDIDVCKNMKQLKDDIGYVPDFFGVYDNLKVMEYLEFYASCYGLIGQDIREHCFELMDLMGLIEKADAYVDDLSRGMQQKLCLARALVHNPRILILDEPASGLDPRSRMEFIQILQELSMSGKTIFISSHILSELAKMCNSIGIIQKGSLLLQGSIDYIVSTMNTINPLLIKVNGDPEPIVRFLREYPLVKTMAIDKIEIQLMFEGDTSQEAILLRELIEQGFQVISFGRKKDNLETIYLNLTNRS